LLELQSYFSQIKIILLSVWDSAVPFKYDYWVWLLFVFYHTVISRNFKKDLPMGNLPFTLQYICHLSKV